MEAVTSIRVSGQLFPVVWQDNYTAEKLRKRFPWTLTLQEIHGCMKFAMLQKPLPFQPQPLDLAQTGDLLLYGSSCLVLCYQSFPTALSMTRLGRLENADRLAQVIGADAVEIEFL